MAAAGDASSTRSLENTPTWALAAVCFVMISISIILEHSFHLLINWLKKRRKNALIDAVDKLKSELMLLGFMSLILAVSQSSISKICVPTETADIMLPCRQPSIESQALKVQNYEHYFVSKVDGKLSSKEDPYEYIANVNDTGATMDSCTSDGKVSLISEDGIHQLHLFIFTLAVMQIVYSTLTMALGRAKAHFSSSVNNFNFQKYIKRALEEDFKAVVGISPLMWFFVVIFLLVDVYDWQEINLWISYIPLLIVLVLGTKLEAIVARMALQINDRSNTVRGIPLVHPNDNLFWFGRPRFVLVLLHLTLFMNAFELAFFIWVSIQFGVDSCYHEHRAITVTRVVLAIVVQVLCSYVTLPLYALVTQMGSKFKSRILEEKIAKIMKQWLAEVRERRKKQEQQSLQSPRTSLLAEWSSKRGSPAAEFSTILPRPTSMFNESIRSANKGKITAEEEPSSSRGPSPSIRLQMQLARRD
ncbi:hypothetical protein JRO89_XS12G0032200 [Xanthoceras sorbifolium]|uniref:MLO-like protein n=1 Tax=Xanthoceras sorbifolium TaxID=99658 RepID=A0ABQ8HAU2_9ROSI|nr:hypothetical protein JRO89_XS12G0032200 [Xanthoceras sorbifolium]